MQLDTLIPLSLSFIAGALIGCLIYLLIQKIRLSHFKQLAAEILRKAESDGEALKKNAELITRQQQIDQQREFENRWQQERKKIQIEDDRLKLREDKLETRLNLVEKKLTDLEKREAVLLARKMQLEEETKAVSDSQDKLLLRLEKIAGLTTKEAKETLFNEITLEVKRDAANFIRKTTKETTEEADREASKIIATAINRMAVPCVSEVTVNTVSIPNEEMKGRIIGREGRNIRALERATGINFIIDDTPGAVVLSGFDPIRMHIAKVALTDLVQDGRVHPTRIEEVVEKAKINVEKMIKKHGEDAALRVGIIDLHPELSHLLGKLKFRFSYGQNVLDHSLEVAHLMGIMAAELGLDVRLAKRIGLLHDFGKSLSQEVEGSHAIIGHDFALKYGESKEVANGIGCHHGEIEPSTVEASLCSAADAISASRQGARSEFVEEYVKRLKRLEDLACEFSGVEKAYAMQAGREIRVVVLPDHIDDDGVINLAKDLTKRIEQDLSYPGKIKVTVIREKRVVEYAM
ncbi:MAG TPA: ribonuclease Y [Parachlamydiaceae bacterium]|nr:ribonuclease Y [Parachlamydiaceae bacterium]